MLYSQNVFFFNQLDAVLNFSSTILPQRLHTIRSLRLRWYFTFPFHSDFGSDVPSLRLHPPHDEATWAKVWGIIAGMQGLRDLRVHIWSGFNITTSTIEARILEPLRAVKGMETFEVKVPWEGNYEMEAPFKITRPQIPGDRES